jgi:acetolactate synthase-1/2/3 large subunit
MLYTEAAVADAPHYRRASAAPSPRDMAELQRLLAASERPLVIVGGGGWTADALAKLRAWAEGSGLPVAASMRCQDYFDNRSPSYAGDVGIAVNPKLAQRVKDADLLLVIGARLGEMTTAGYTLLEVPVPRQKLVHVHAGAEELGRVYHATLPINSGYPQFAEALAQVKLDGAKWRDSTRSAHAEFEAWLKPQPIPGALQYGEVVAWLSERLPEDAIVCNGAGNFAVWVNRHFRYKRYRTQLAPTSGSMGYGVPAAVAAKIAHPGRTVVAVAGDGDFLMNGQEIATAAQYGAPIVVLVVNNGMYATIRMHQEREFPGRVSGSDLFNPDFAALARAYGWRAATIGRTAEFEPAFREAMATPQPALLHLKLDVDTITTRTTLGAIRASALVRRGRE